MRTLQLHPSSLLAGIGLSVLVFVAMGQKSVPTGTPSAVSLPVGEYGDELQRQPKFAVHPRDWVQIEEGVPYVVPAKKLFVPTALGAILEPPPSQDDLTTLRVDGVDMASAITATYISGSNGMTAFGSGANMKPLPRGLSVPAGSTVEVAGGVRSSTPDDARAWGYLVDE